MTARRVLVLGGSGFIGTHVRRALALDPHASDVVAVSRQPLTHPFGHEVRMDLIVASHAEIRDLLVAERPTAVINCAGATGGDLGSLLMLNAVLVAKLIEVLEGMHPSPHLVHLASAAECSPLSRPESTSEVSPTDPATPYGVTKLAGTRLVTLAAESGRVDATVLRLFNPVGSGMSDATLPGRGARLIHLALDRGDSEVAFGDLSAYRDFVHVEDVADAIVATAMSPASSDHLLHIGSGHALLARDVVHMIAEVAGFSGEIRESADGSPRSSAVAWQRADIGRATSLLDWSPKRSISDAVSQLWHWETRDSAGR